MYKFKYHKNRNWLPTISYNYNADEVFCFAPITKATYLPNLVGFLLMYAIDTDMVIDV